jgi:hypothetical protein
MFVIKYANVDHTIVASVSVHVISPKHARIRLRLSEWIGVVVIHTLSLSLNGATFPRPFQSVPLLVYICSNQAYIHPIAPT